MKPSKHQQQQQSDRQHPQHQQRYLHRQQQKQMQQHQLHQLHQQHQQRQHQQHHRIWLSCLLDIIAERLLYEAASNRKKSAHVYDLYCYYKPKIRARDRLIDGRSNVRVKAAEMTSLLSGAIGFELERIERSLLLLRGGEQ